MDMRLLPEAAYMQVLEGRCAMTDNRTTELLRKMLDERGIKWKNIGGTTSGDGITEWLVDGMTCQAAQRVTVGIEHLALCIPVLTPEQAIAATLGLPEIVRCRDCEHRYACGSFMFCELRRPYEPVNADGFCAWGVKRKEGGDD